MAAAYVEEDNLVLISDLVIIKLLQVSMVNNMNFIQTKQTVFNSKIKN